MCSLLFITIEGGLIVSGMILSTYTLYVMTYKPVLLLYCVVIIRTIPHSRQQEHVFSRAWSLYPSQAPIKPEDQGQRGAKSFQPILNRLKLCCGYKMLEPKYSVEPQENGQLNNISLDSLTGRQV